MEQTFLSLSEFHIRSITQISTSPDYNLTANVLFCDDGTQRLQVYLNDRPIYGKKLNKSEWAFSPKGILLSSKLVDKVWEFITT